MQASPVRWLTHADDAAPHAVPARYYAAPTVEDVEEEEEPRPNVSGQGTAANPFSFDEPDDVFGPDSTASGHASASASEAALEGAAREHEGALWGSAGGSRWEPEMASSASV